MCGALYSLLVFSGLAIFAVGIPIATAEHEEQLHIRLDLSSGSVGVVPMVSSTPQVSWELPPYVVKQNSFEVRISELFDQAVFRSGMVQSSSQSFMLPMSAGLKPATSYTIVIAVNGTDVTHSSVNVISSSQHFFTALLDWGAKPIWSGAPTTLLINSPDFAYFSRSYAIPFAERAESVLAFVTARGPLSIQPDYGCCGEVEQSSKILAAYKLFINGNIVGVGPGHSRCDAVAQGD